MTTRKGWSADAMDRLGVIFEDGRFVFRLETDDGVDCGAVRYRDHDGPGRKVLADEGSVRELWPRPEVVAGATLYVVEGEPDALTMAELGLPAVGYPGTGKSSPEWTRRLVFGPNGRRERVVFVPDCDDGGRKKAHELAAEVAALGMPAYVADLAPDRADKYDVGDLLMDALEYDPETGREFARRIIEARVTDAEEIAPAKTTDFTLTPDERARLEREDAPPPPTDEGVAVLRALFGALPVDAFATSLDPLEPLAGAPFLLPGATAQLAGPEGAGKSQVAQVIAYDVALTGGRVLYLAGEVTHREFSTRARKISEARDGELSEESAALWRERVAFADTGDVLPAIWRHLAAWNVVCGDFTLVVLDAVSDAGAALDLKFARDNDDWFTFHQAFVKPCQDRTALLMLDNIGHGEDAKKRALGASAKGHKVDIRLSSYRREDPLSLVIRCEKARPERSSFKRGDRWVAYEAGCRPPVVYDARQRELEAAEPDAPDPVAVVVTVLKAEAPQGQRKLEAALREAGVKGRATALRDAIKAMADDPKCPVIDTGGAGFNLDPKTPWPDPVSVSRVRGPYTDGATDGPDGQDGQGVLLSAPDRTGGRDFSAVQPTPPVRDDDDAGDWRQR